MNESGWIAVRLDLMRKGELLGYVQRDEEGLWDAFFSDHRGIFIQIGAELESEEKAKRVVLKHKKKIIG